MTEIGWLDEDYVARSGNISYWLDLYTTGTVHCSSTGASELFDELYWKQQSSIVEMDERQPKEMTWATSSPSLPHSHQWLN